MWPDRRNAMLITCGNLHGQNMNSVVQKSYKTTFPKCIVDSLLQQQTDSSMPIVTLVQ